MIAVKLEGRLGNQLFQYAFIYTAAKKLNSSFYIDKSIIPFILPKYFNINNDVLQPVDKWVFSINGFKNLFNFHLKRLFYDQLSKLYFGNKKISITNTDQPVIALQRIQNGCLYEGFFQSEKYFEDYKKEIKSIFTIKNKHIDAFNNVVSKFIAGAERKVVIHIRRTDYLDINLTLPLSYYKKAIESVFAENTTYIFVSDDPEYVINEFSYIQNKYVSNHTEIIDLQFLINADVCILSNSSFSWWGAWLNNNTAKKIIAPNNWGGFNDETEYPAGVIQPDWILLDAK